MGTYRAQNSFVGGEISPRMLGRVELPLYKSSAAKIENFIVRVQGGLTTRGGTKFMREVDNSDNYTRGIAFESSRDDGYYLEFGDLYVLPYFKGTPSNSSYRGTWNSLITYALDEVARDVPAPGQPVRYWKSLANGNLGNNPALTSKQTVTKAPISDAVVVGSGWSGSVGSRWDLVNDFPDQPPGDVLEVTGNNTATPQSFTFGGSAFSLPSGATNIKVKLEVYARCTVGGGSGPSIKCMATVGGSDYKGTGTDLTGTTYYLVSKEWTTNPKTSSAWTKDDINGVGGNALGAFGVEVEWPGGGRTVQISGVQLTVTYEPATLKWEYVGDAPPSGNTKITTPYKSSDLPLLRWCQSLDVMWLFHPSYQTRRLARNSDGSWTLTTEAFLDGPWGDLNFTSTTMTSSGASGSVTVTASSATGINGGSGFLSSDVGRLIRIYNSGWAWGQITALTSNKIVTVTVVGGTFPLAGTTQWQLGAYSATTGYPEMGALFEGRLCVAAGERVDASKTDSLLDFGVSDPLVASDACGFKALSNETNEIRWMTASRGGLSVGASSGEWLLNGGGRDEPLSATSVGYRRHTTVGGRALPAIQADEAVLYVKRNGRAVHEFAFTFEKDAFVSPDLSILAEHLFRTNQIVSWDYQRAKDTVWLVREDGTVCSLTYRRPDQVVAWARHDLGGEVLDVCCVNEGDIDVPYFIVRRLVDGQRVQFVEAMQEEFNGELVIDSWQLDCAIEQEGEGFTTVTGLDHLEGETVTAMADGKYAGTYTVSGGEIVLRYAANYAIVGLPFDCTLETLPLEEPALRDGASLGRNKSTCKVGVVVTDTYGGKVGPVGGELDELIFNNDFVLGAAPVLFSGIKEKFIDGSYSEDKRVTVVQDNPFPMTINALVVEWEVV